MSPQHSKVSCNWASVVAEVRNTLVRRISKYIFKIQILTVCEVSNENGALIVAALVLPLIGRHSQNLALVHLLVQGSGCDLRLLLGGHIDESDQRRQRGALHLEQLSAIGLAESDAQHLGMWFEQLLQLDALNGSRQVANKHGNASKTIFCARNYNKKNTSVSTIL